MARTILMIHGYGCAGDCWGSVAARLKAEGYRVETPTLRAELRRPDAPGKGLAALSLADYVADMSALAASLTRETGEAPIVFGHSMGGMIAQKLAEAGLAAGIVLFAPASPADARAKPKLSPVITFLNIALSIRPESRAVKMWKTGFKWGVLNVVPAARHDALYARAVYDSGRALSDLAWPDKDPNRTVHVDATRVKVPVLVAAGAQDRTTPVEDLRLVGAKYDADYVEYPNNAHWLIDEPGVEVILDDVIGWLNTRGLSPARPVKSRATPGIAPKVSTAATPLQAAPAPVSAPAVAAIVEAEAPAKPVAPAKARTPRAAAKPPSGAVPKAKAEPAAPATAAPEPKAASKAAPKARAAAKPAPKAVAKTASRAAPKAAAQKAPEAAPKPAPKAAAKTKTAPKTATKPAAAKPSPKARKSV